MASEASTGELATRSAGSRSSRGSGAGTRRRSARPDLGGGLLPGHPGHRSRATKPRSRACRACTSRRSSGRSSRRCSCTAPTAAPSPRRRATSAPRPPRSSRPSSTTRPARASSTRRCSRRTRPHQTPATALARILRSGRRLSPRSCEILEHRAEALRGEKRWADAVPHRRALRGPPERPGRGHAPLRGDPRRGRSEHSPRSRASTASTTAPAGTASCSAILERQIHAAVTPRQRIELYERIAAIYDEEFLDHEQRRRGLRSHPRPSIPRRTSRSRRSRATTARSNAGRTWSRPTSGTSASSPTTSASSSSCSRSAGCSPSKSARPTRARRSVYERCSRSIRTTRRPRGAGASSARASGDSTLRSAGHRGARPAGHDARGQGRTVGARGQDPRGQGRSRRRHRALQAGARRAARPRRAAEALRAAYTGARRRRRRGRADRAADRGRREPLSKARLSPRWRASANRSSRTTNAPCAAATQAQSARSDQHRRADGPRRPRVRGRSDSSRPPRTTSFPPTAPTSWTARTRRASSCATSTRSTRPGRPRRRSAPMDTLLKLAPERRGGAGAGRAGHLRPRRSQARLRALPRAPRPLPRRLDRTEEADALYRLGESARRAGLLDYAFAPLAEAADLDSGRAPSRWHRSPRSTRPRATGKTSSR